MQDLTPRPAPARRRRLHRPQGRLHGNQLHPGPIPLPGSRSSCIPHPDRGGRLEPVLYPEEIRTCGQISPFQCL